MSTPFVSIVIPAYRASRWIPETLDSVFRQTYTDYEVLVVDQDCDEAMDRALAPFLQRITRLTLQPPGVSAARNLAIRHARGEFIANLDADDVWLPSALERMVELLRSRSLDAITPNAVFFGEPLTEGKTFQDLLPSCGHPITYSDVLERRTYVFSGAVYRKSIAAQVKLYNESLSFGEDFDLWLRMLRAGAKFDYTEEVLTRYRRSPEAACASPRIGQVLSIYDAQPCTTKAERKVIRRMKRTLFAEHLSFNLKKKVKSVIGRF